MVYHKTGNSSALAMELLQSWTKPSICFNRLTLVVPVPYMYIYDGIHQHGVCRCCAACWYQVICRHSIGIPMYNYLHIFITCSYVLSEFFNGYMRCQLVRQVLAMICVKLQLYHKTNEHWVIEDQWCPIWSLSKWSALVLLKNNMIIFQQNILYWIRALICICFLSLLYRPCDKQL